MPVVSKWGDWTLLEVVLEKVIECERILIQVQTAVNTGEFHLAQHGARFDNVCGTVHRLNMLVNCLAIHKKKGDLIDHLRHLSNHEAADRLQFEEGSCTMCHKKMDVDHNHVCWRNDDAKTT